MGGIVDAIGGLFGAGGGGSGGNVTPLQYTPYDVSTPFGQVRGTPGGIQAETSPELSVLYRSLLGQANTAQGQIPTAQSLMGAQGPLQQTPELFLNQAQGLLAQGGPLQQSSQRVLDQASQFQQTGSDLLNRAQQLQVSTDPQAAVDFQRRVYGPEFQRQQLSQESRLFNQGLLGSTTGGLQQEAVRNAQNQALLRGARDQQQLQLQQQQQGFGQELGLLGQALRAQQLGLGAEAQGSQMDIARQQLGFGAAGQASQQDLARRQLEAALQGQARGQQFQSLEAALGIEQAPFGLLGLSSELGGQALDAQIGTQNLRSQAETNQQNFFGGLAGTAAEAGAFSGLGGALKAGAGMLFSDIRLKKNVTPIGNGLYSWQWNEKAKEIGADVYPTTGVIAQEIMEIYPEAVFESKHGYLMVDYSKVA